MLVTDKTIIGLVASVLNYSALNNSGIELEELEKLSVDKLQFLLNQERKVYFNKLKRRTRDRLNKCNDQDLIMRGTINSLTSFVL